MTDVKNPIIDYQTSMRKFGMFSSLLLDGPYRDLWRNITPFLKLMKFYNAPASTKFHLSCPGGLLMHSVNVVDTAIMLSGEKFPGIKPDKILLAGLLHDIGKCGFLQDDGTLVERYVKNPEPFPTWPKQQKWWAPYLYQDSEPLFNVRDLSALYVSQWGCPWDVVQAVLAHDGVFVEANKDYFKSTPAPLTLLLHLADYMSCAGLESKSVVYRERCEQ